MPLQPEEVLQQITAAIEEAKGTIRELHTARKDAIAVIKENDRKIRESIEAEVHKVVGELSSSAEKAMHLEVSQVINRLEGAWRDKLGLP